MEEEFEKRAREETGQLEEDLEQLKMEYTNL